MTKAELVKQITADATEFSTLGSMGMEVAQYLAVVAYAIATLED